ncbi:cyanase [Pseudooceanicola algae]|uniref:Cyanate lyase C-terminal domain-containing protein n=1 Tax=Pseudooceanicola algae TaxID=1537215 RepID=A0A418SIR7_9RHOB|nr:hypothetical protein [Pseudooceanicola algae]QPM91212.1 hypothetical protein PSAL_024620 [Pseudooceanicola algae]
MKDLAEITLLEKEDVTALIIASKRAAGLTRAGIAEAIGMSVTRVPSPKGDRVQVTMSGKYLAFNSW